LFAANGIDTGQGRKAVFSCNGQRMAGIATAVNGVSGVVVIWDVTGKHAAGAAQQPALGNAPAMPILMAGVPHVERSHDGRLTGETFVACGWNPLNHLLAVSGSLGQVHLFNEATGEAATSLSVGTPATDLEWSPLGIRLATAHGDGKVRIWDTTEHAQPDADAPELPAVGAQPAAPEAAGGLSAEFQARLGAIGKLITAEMWDEVHTQIAELEATDLTDGERAAIKTKVRGRLDLLAKNALQAAGRAKNQDVDKYIDYLQKAMAIDPEGNYGKQAARLLERCP
jgi:hypothetical protein